jgi:GT2 family glycosyltransferase
MVTLSVVVPATDAPPTLARCLRAIESADEAPEQVVVVDVPASLSAAGARNAGAAGARGDVIVFVDADVEVHPAAFARIRARFSADPGLDAVYGSYDDTPGARGIVSVFRNLLHHHVHHQSAGPAETFWTGLGAVRRSWFEAVGGFDEDRYPHPSVEDIDFGHRLRAAGARIALDPTIQGTHLKAWTLRTMVWTDFARRGVPWVELQWRARRVSSALNLGWRHRFSALACLVGVLGALAGRWVLATVSIAALLLLNRSFYLLLLRRLGPVRAAAGVGLHAVHHLVATASLVAGVAAVLLTSGSDAWSRRRVRAEIVEDASVVE